MIDSNESVYNLDILWESISDLLPYDMAFMMLQVGDIPENLPYGWWTPTSRAESLKNLGLVEAYEYPPYTSQGITLFHRNAKWVAPTPLGILVAKIAYLCFMKNETISPLNNTWFKDFVAAREFFHNLKHRKVVFPESSGQFEDWKPEIDDTTREILEELNTQATHV